MLVGRPQARGRMPRGRSAVRHLCASLMTDKNSLDSQVLCCFSLGVIIAKDCFMTVLTVSLILVTLYRMLSDPLTTPSSMSFCLNGVRHRSTSILQVITVTVRVVFELRTSGPIGRSCEAAAMYATCCSICASQIVLLSLIVISEYLLQVRRCRSRRRLPMAS